MSLCFAQLNKVSVPTSASERNSRPLRATSAQLWIFVEAVNGSAFLHLFTLADHGQTSNLAVPTCSSPLLSYAPGCEGPMLTIGRNWVDAHLSCGPHGTIRSLWRQPLCRSSTGGWMPHLLCTRISGVTREPQ